jgi:diguanylate cyclase (GGDEF)-like protein
MDCATAGRATVLILGRCGWVVGLIGLGLLLVAGPDEVHHDRTAAVALLVVYGGAIVSAVAGAFARPDGRLAWLLLAGGLAAYAAGGVAYALDPSVVTTFPSVADIGLFIFYPLALATLVLLVRSPFPGFGLVNWMDLSISAFAVAAVGALVLLPTSLDTLTANQLGYVIGDLVLVGFLAATLTVADSGSIPALRLLCLGAVVVAIGDTFQAGGAGSGHVATGLVPSIAWPLGVLILGAAPTVLRWRRAGTLVPGRASIAVPLLSAAICLPIAIHPGNDDLVARMLAGAALATVLARLSVNLRERERLVGQLSQVNAELAHAAIHDVLTGLGNRDLLTRVNEERGPGPQASRALVLIDLDDFKAINDTFGHETGDRVLQAVADRVRASVRPQDLVVRLGGDEFAVLLSGADEELSCAVATRFLATLEQPLEIASHAIFVRASVGVAVGTEGESLATLMRRADASMYRAKSSDSPDPISVFDPSTHHQILENLALASDLRGALARDELVLHYQPIVELATRRTVGFEALVRWQHPEHGLVPPMTFIPLAEQGGLMPDIGAWVLEQACREASRWPAGADGTAPYISVNLSVRQLQDADFPARFHRALQHARLPLDRLVVEVTETALATEQEAIRAPLEQLRALGIRVYIDDFGTGYSSLGYIRELPLDGVKLDRTFARDLTTSSEAWTLAQAIVALLDDLGLSLTAEGIESAAQLAQLRSLGCVYAQGYYFARPQPAEALEDLIPAAAAEAAS